MVADRDRLKDLIASILEDMAGIGGQQITVSNTKETNRGFVTVRAEFLSSGIDFPGDRLGFMIKECELSGGFFSTETEGSVISTVIELPAI